MTERITSQMVANDTLTTIDNDLNQLDTVQEDLSTGYQINEPSDDPYGASLTLSLEGQISAYSSYQDNISQGLAEVETTSSSLESIEQVAESVRDLTVEGANSTLNSDDLSDAAEEVLAYIGQIKTTADTQYDGSYIFSGTDVDTAPWDSSSTGSDAYQGNTDTTSYAIGPSTTLQTSADLYSVLGDGNGPAGAFTAADSTTGTASSGGLLATLRQIYDDMSGTDGGSQSDLETQLTNLDDNISQLETLQAQVGATQDQLEMASSRITSLSTADTTELGSVYDTDEAAATVDYSTDQAGYEAALQSTADIIQTSLMNFLDT